MRMMVDLQTAQPMSVFLTPKLTAMQPPATSVPVRPHIQSIRPRKVRNGGLASYLAFHCSRKTIPCFASTATTSSAMTKAAGLRWSPLAIEEKRNGARRFKARTGIKMSICRQTCSSSNGKGRATIRRFEGFKDIPAVINAETAQKPPMKFQSK